MQCWWNEFFFCFLLSFCVCFVKERQVYVKWWCRKTKIKIFLPTEWMFDINNNFFFCNNNFIIIRHSLFVCIHKHSMVFFIAIQSFHKAIFLCYFINYLVVLRNLLIPSIFVFLLFFGFLFIQNEIFLLMQYVLIFFCVLASF